MSEDNFLSWLESNHLDKDIDIWHICKLEVKNGTKFCKEEAELSF